MFKGNYLIYDYTKFCVIKKGKLYKDDKGIYKANEFCS